MKSREDAYRSRRDDYRVLGALLMLEFIFLLYALFKGTGLLFLQISALLMCLTVVSYIAVKKIRADRYLIIIALVQLNIGFFIQMLSEKGESGLLTDLLAKCGVAFAAAFAAGTLFLLLARWISTDAAALVLAGIQIALIILLGILGTEVGKGGQGAKIQLEIPGIFSFQPLEVVKVLYVFAAAILLCKDERIGKKILGVPRELFLLIYTGILLVSLAAFREMGTGLIMFLTGAVMMFIYSSNRKLVGILAAGTATLAAAGWGMLLLLQPSEGSFAGKVFARFRYFLSPELDASNAGYQGLQMRKAMTVGGLLGPDTDRYLFTIPMEKSDMVFAKLVQTCGVVMGFVLLLSFFFLFQRGMTISRNCRDCYFKGTAMGITVLFAAESTVHIAYNIGAGPITGIPLYLVSEGFTATTTGMMMIAVLLVISSGAVERSRGNESRIDRRMENLCEKVHPYGRRA